MNFYKRWIGDYRRDTGHLSLIEHGAYTLMLDAFYASEKPLPIDRVRLYRLLGASEQNEVAAVELVLSEFWKEAEAGFVNSRALREIGRAAEYSAEQSARGKLGGRPKKAIALSEESERLSEGFSEGKQTPKRTESRGKASHSHSHSSIAKNQEPQSQQHLKPPARKLADKSTPNGFDQFWDAYPKGRKVGKKAALKAWKKLNPGSALSKHITQAITTQTQRNHFQNHNGDDFIPNPLTWLNQGRWDDEITGPPKRKMRSAIAEMEEAGLLDD